jgi:hypothetical protein
MCSPWFCAFFCTELLVADELANKNLPDLISLLLEPAREPEAKGRGG